MSLRVGACGKLFCMLGSLKTAIKSIIPKRKEQNVQDKIIKKLLFNGLDQIRQSHIKTVMAGADKFQKWIHFTNVCVGLQLMIMFMID